MAGQMDSNNELIKRHKSESHHFDQRYSQPTRPPRHYDVNPTYVIYEKMLDMAAPHEGRAVLEYGCGKGWVTRDLARNGAVVSAFDISAEAVRQTQELLLHAGVADRCRVVQMGAEKLDYPDESFDLAIGFAILHHLDLKLAIPEMCRVLKPGGIAYFAEPLGSNPLINLYRKMTPQYRTEDEEPLDLGSLIPRLRKVFREVKHQEFFITALAALAITYLPMGRTIYPSVNRRLMSFDELLMRRFPKAGRLAWYTILSMRK